MGNRLFQEARKYVNLAQSVTGEQQQQAVDSAKNALVSAYANSTLAEQAQLSQLQSELENLQ